MINKIKNLFLVAAAALALGSCQKMDRPELGEVITDTQTLPSGPLRFFADFNKTNGSSPRWNAADSISGNPAQIFPLSFVPGINGNAVQGKDKAAILYLNANDLSKAKSFTVAFWIKKQAEAGRTEFIFSLVQPNYEWHNSSLFLLVENEKTTSTTMKFGIKNQWMEGTFNKPLFDGNWHHMAYVYDASTSKLSYYFDGQPVTGLTSTQTDVKGPISLEGSTNLVIGGWNTHAGIAGATGDWVNSFTGALDQFRLYDKALTGAEVQALFSGKI